MTKSARRILEWTIALLIASISFYALGREPQDHIVPAQIVLPLPDDISTFHCPGGYIDPEFVDGGILCVRNDSSRKL